MRQHCCVDPSGNFAAVAGVSDHFEGECRLSIHFPTLKVKSLRRSTSYKRAIRERHVRILSFVRDGAIKFVLSLLPHPAATVSPCHFHNLSLLANRKRRRERRQMCTSVELGWRWGLVIEFSPSVGL